MRMDRYEKRKKKFNIIMTVVVGFLMVASIFAFVLFDTGQTTSSMTYNSKTFTTTNSGYRTKISGKYMDFYYFPSELERINLDPSIISMVKNSQGIAFVFDPNDNTTDDLTYIDTIRYDLQTQMDKPTYFGISGNSPNYNLPIISCENSTAIVPFFIINISTETSFNLSQKYPYCVTMNGKLKDILALKDRLVYTYYGIMS